MRLNKYTIDLIKHYEWLRLESYPDPATGGDPWTIGYGDTGPHVRPGQVITEEEAERRLYNRLRGFERGVLDLVQIPLNNNQLGALVSFSYNVGLGNFRKSTMLRLVNARDFWGAADEFPRWNKAAGRVLKGLTLRRGDERLLFLSPESIGTPVKFTPISLETLSLGVPVRPIEPEAVKTPSPKKLSIFDRIIRWLQDN